MSFVLGDLKVSATEHTKNYKGNEDSNADYIHRNRPWATGKRVV